MGVRVAAQADDIQTPHPLSTTSGAYYRGDRQNEHGGGGGESEQACVWNTYDKVEMFGVSLGVRASTYFP